MNCLYVSVKIRPEYFVNFQAVITAPTIWKKGHDCLIDVNRIVNRNQQKVKKMFGFKGKR